MIDRSRLSTLLAKAIANAQAGKESVALEWAATLNRELVAAINNDINPAWIPKPKSSPASPRTIHPLY